MVEVVPPTVTISGPSTVNEDATYTLDLSATGEPSNHPITGWTINWGDGNERPDGHGQPEQRHARLSPTPVRTRSRRRRRRTKGRSRRPPRDGGRRSRAAHGHDQRAVDASTRTRPTHSISRRPGEPSNHPITVGPSTGATGRAIRRYGNPNSATHVYADAGSYTITASATEDEGDVLRRSADCHGRVVPPTVDDQRAVHGQRGRDLHAGPVGDGRAVQPSDHELDDQLGRRTAHQTVTGNPEQRDPRLRRRRFVHDHGVGDRGRRDVCGGSPLNVTAVVVPPTVTISGTATVNEDATYTLNLSATGEAVEPSDHELDDQLGRRHRRPQTVSGQPEQRNARLRGRRFVHDHRLGDRG